jgi:hypothetical protein
VVTQAGGLPEPPATQRGLGERQAACWEPAEPPQREGSAEARVRRRRPGPGDSPGAAARPDGVEVRAGLPDGVGFPMVPPEPRGEDRLPEVRGGAAPGGAAEPQVPRWQPTESEQVPCPAQPQRRRCRHYSGPAPRPRGLWRGPPDRWWRNSGR